jgi:hypothetical protein
MPRFYDSPVWHELITDRQSETVTLLDRRATDRSIVYELGTAARWSGTVPSDDPEINIPHDDGFTTGGNFSDADYPFVAEGVRLLYALRRDGRVGLGETPYQCRYAGIVLNTNDQADANTPHTTLTALDPWAYLERIPARPPARLVAGTPDTATFAAYPGPDGLHFFDQPANEIVGILLRNAIDGDDGNCYIDAGDGSNPNSDGNDYGGTSDWDGFIQECQNLTISFQRDTTIGEALKQVMDSGLAFIHLRPIYDPVNRPGILCELNIYRPNSVNPFQDEASSFPTMSWDRSGRALTSLGREVDGTARANELRLYGANNKLVGFSSSGPDFALESTLSVERFGRYWEPQTLVRHSRKEVLSRTAQKLLTQKEQGRRTWRPALAPELEIIPFRDFDLGWEVCLYHSRRLREELWDCHAVLGFTLSIDNDTLETVTDLLLSTDDDGGYPTITPPDLAPSGW